MNQPKQPLAERMRPQRLSRLKGQEEITGPGTAIHSAIKQDQPFSMILWGPPGCGKTTLARIMSMATGAAFTEFSAVLSGVKDIRAVIASARTALNEDGARTLLFVDEIHRFNKSQQDAFLPHVESGLITLVGATTENPSFEVIPALLSRCKVFVLKTLSAKALTEIVAATLNDMENGLGQTGLTLGPEALLLLAESADGDARRALNSLEIAAEMALAEKETAISAELVHRASAEQFLRYDKTGEEHYNLISALHKSLRGSDPDAAIYWLQRMLMGGEDPLYIARRMIRFASEDIGNADPNALAVALNATETYRMLGSPEGELALSQAALYLATAPKSNRIYTAHKAAAKCAKKTGALETPLHIRNAPTRLMKDLGYGKNYRYAHDHENAFTVQEYLPESLEDQIFYHPSSRGYEGVIKKRLTAWRAKKRQTLKKKKSKSSG